MTHASKLKKQIRARASKTGESYAAARRQVLAARAKRAGGLIETPQAAPPPAPSSALGGVSDSKVLETTGRGLEHWFGVLDRFGAAERGHTAAARHLRKDHGLSAWYSQGITVAYERARGLRGINQDYRGRFQVSVSRVLPADVPTVVEALCSSGRRRQWLADADPELVRALRAGLRAKSDSMTIRAQGDARLRYRWGVSTVELVINPQPAGRSTIVASNSALAGAQEVEPRREAWKFALDRLRQHLVA